MTSSDSRPDPHQLEQNELDDWETGQSRAPEQQLCTPGYKCPVRERMKHFTWAWYTVTISTGVLGLLFYNTPHRFDGLTAIGKVAFILAIVLFVISTAIIIYRFIKTPRGLKTSLLHPTESLFFPAFLLSLAIILANSAIYGVPASGPWLPVALRVCFWIYAALALSSSVIQYTIVFYGAKHSIKSMSPLWIFPIFPTLLTGVVASTIAPSQPPSQRLPILVAGVTYLGLGFSVAFILYSLYIYRLTQEGFPAPPMRPGMFIAVGPPGFTSTGLIGLSRSIPTDYAYFARFPIAPQILKVMALWIGIWMWALAFWFFAFSTIAFCMGIAKNRIRFSMAWWALVFPNTAFTIATSLIGEELDSDGIKGVASAMTILIVLGWFVVLFAHIRAVLRSKVLWPGRDEDFGHYNPDKSGSRHV
ncbi:voltage-dependent anion channel [Mariannaea sp. PMI_226]|nr:voltage-dependent anion channel [Mariannaea sp. PMI_226]